MSKARPELPKGWALATTEQLCFVETGATPKKSERRFYSENGASWITSTAVNSDPILTEQAFITDEALRETNAKVFPAGSLVLALYGEGKTRGKVSELGIPAATNQACAAMLIGHLDSTVKRFLKMFYQYNYETIRLRSSGGVQPNLNLGIVKATVLPFPPLNEQQRIVEKVEILVARLDKGEEAVREVQKLLTRYRQSVLKSAVTGQLTADWRAQHEGQSEHGRELLNRILEIRREKWEGRGKFRDAPTPDVSDLPALPESWVWSSLGQLMHKIDAGKNYKCEERPPKDGETGIVKISAVTWEEFDEEESKTILSADHLHDAYLIEEGDLLISRANTVELVGASVVVRKVEKRLQLSDKVLRLRLVEPIEDWVNYVLKSAIGRKQIEAFATGAQMSMRNISQGNLERIAIPLPPTSEMKHCVKTIRDAHERNATLTNWSETELKRSASLRQSILKDAFAGKLVPQDPADEPASALLAHIAAEKPTAKKPRRKTPA